MEYGRNRPYAKLRGRMEEMGYTQRIMAEALGISESAFNKKITGKNDFSVPEVLKISQKLECLGSIEDIFFS